MRATYEVHWRNRRRTSRKSRINSWIQTVFKIQKRPNWNSHLRCLWNYCIPLIEKCRCVLGTSTRVSIDHIREHPCAGNNFISYLALSRFMTQWEYRIVEDSDASWTQITKMLNDLGSQGWELVSTKGKKPGKLKVFFFKRPL